MARRLKFSRLIWGSAIAAGAIYLGFHLAGAGTPLSSGPLRKASPSPQTPRTTSVKRVAKPLPSHYLIHVPGKDQYPQLPNGCEVTSLAMLMTAVGHPVSKMTLAKKMPVDPTKLVMASHTNSKGQVVHHVVYWGNPNVGFVGKVNVAGYGYGIYNKPLAAFLNRLLPGRAVNLTGRSFNTILKSVVTTGIPVEVWTTTTFHPTTDWVTWNSPEGTVKATPYEHAVLIVGYTKNSLYINNPLNGHAAQKVAKGPFIQAWHQLGKQAITVKPK